MLSDDFIHQLFTKSNQAELEAAYVAVLFFLNLCLWASGMRWFVMSIAGMFALMQLLQLGHISITGSPLTPYDLGKAVDEWAEIQIALRHELLHHWYVFIAWGVPYTLLMFLFYFKIHGVSPEGRWIPLIIVLAILGSKPERALRRDMIAFLPGPTRSSLHNSINTYSYYLASMLGRDQSLHSPEFSPYVIRNKAGQYQSPDNIVMLVIDSLRYDRLGIAGYARETTPNLRELFAAGELQLAHGIAAAVATGASLPLMLNTVNEPGNMDALQGQAANLFRKAKEAGYKTFWLSTQESKLLNGVGSQYIDVNITKEDDPIGIMSSGDEILDEWLAEQAWGSRNFVFILLRSVHLPYQENYASSESFVEKWPTNAPGITREGVFNNAYDNAVLYMDQLLKDSFDKLGSVLEGNTVVIVTSDHGQMVGENNRWGHNRLHPMVASVPVMLYKTKAWQDSPEINLPDQDYISHYELSGWILGMMGFDLINPNKTPGLHYFHSDNIYGDNLYQPVVESNHNLKFCEKSQVSGFILIPSCAKQDNLVESGGKGNEKLVIDKKTLN